MTETKLTGKQELFVTWYCKLLNATKAAKRAGYTGNDDTMRVVGAENLAKPYIKAEIDKRLKANIIGADELLSLMSTTATMDVTEYAREDGTLDVKAMGEDGLGHLVVGVKPGRQGPEVTLASPQIARKTLARYHRLLDRHVDLDVTTTQSIDPDTLASLAAQIAAAQAMPTDSDDAP